MLDYKSVSLANQVFETIERNIVNGVYPAGSILSESKLSEELGVSRTPIREALTKLEVEKLISTSAAGTIVLGITKYDVEDMFFVKKQLEPFAFRLAADNISDEALDKLRNIIEQQEFYAMKKDTEATRNLDTQFHDIIYSQAKSPVLFSILSPNHHKLLKFRKDSLEKSDRILHSVEEHTALYEALKERDGEKAEKLMREHIEHTYENLKKEAL